VSKNKFIKSFKCAYEGIKVCFKSERNIKIHLTVMLIVIAAAILLDASISEWIILIILFGLVISAEMINSSMENIVDLLCDEYNASAKRAKDIAAGSVLILAFASAIIGLLIFVPKIIDLLLN